MPSNLIDIHLNGDPYSVPAGSTLLDLLATLEIEPGRVAIELDREIVRKPSWAETRLAPGSKVEIVQFVGGG